jgi:nicotinate-nucleotide adenylyltransferase
MTLSKISGTHRIGIYAGTFDPVHAGHIAFALQALTIAQLDEVYFLPERQPRNKHGVEHFAHRVAMLSRALRPYKQFHVLEQPDISFSVERTLPRLQTQFKDNQLVFLFGSDIVTHIMEWPKVDRLLTMCELVIGLRAKDDENKIKSYISAWRVQPTNLTIFASYAPNISSGRVRAALRKREYVQGLLSSVQRYSDHNWLYVSFG